MNTRIVRMRLAHPAAALLSAAGMVALMLAVGGCKPKADDERSANAPPVNTKAPVPTNIPSNAPPAVATSIQASQAQGQSMATRAAADGAAAAAAQARSH